MATCDHCGALQPGEGLREAFDRFHDYYDFAEPGPRHIYNELAMLSHVTELLLADLLRKSEADKPTYRWKR